MNQDQANQVDNDPQPAQRWQLIRSKLERAKHHLTTAGSVIKKGASTSPDRWVCRYRERVDGRIRHRSVYLGGESMARKAKALIQAWRDEAMSPEDRRRAKLLALYDLTARHRGYTCRARGRLRKAAVKAFGNPHEELRFASALGEDEPAIRDGRPPGRPARSGLW